MELGRNGWGVNEWVGWEREGGATRSGWGLIGRGFNVVGVNGVGVMRLGMKGWVGSEGMGGEGRQEWVGKE